MRILFMGTPDIAAASLQALLDAGHEVCAVFTRRDKPVGRKQILTAPPVKQLAVERGIPVYQPCTLRDGSADDIIQRAGPGDHRGGGLRLHPPAASCCMSPSTAASTCMCSLLPKYRGSAPIQWAVHQR